MKPSPDCDWACSNPNQDQPKSRSEQLNFIQKAYQLVNNPSNCQLIHWSRSGQTFIIEDIQKFQRELLPLYFRHNRYQSFVRQLNMYDFHKIRNGDYYCDNKSEFRHQEFVRGNFESICQIRRKGFQAKCKNKVKIKVKVKNNIKNKDKDKVDREDRDKQNYVGRKCGRKGGIRKNLRRKKMALLRDSSGRILGHAQNSAQVPASMQDQAKLQSQSNEVSLQPQPQMQAQPSQPQPQPESQNQNSFFIDLPPNPDPFPTLPQKQKRQKLQSIFSSLIVHMEQKNLSRFCGKNTINLTIQLAELVKSQWLETCEKIGDSEDIRNMKSLYYRAKEYLNGRLANNIEAKMDTQNQQIDKTTIDPIQAQPQPQSQEQKIQYMIEQQDAIVDSILRAEIRSTLICITSETFISSNKHRKIDTLIGI